MISSTDTTVATNVNECRSGRKPHPRPQGRTQFLCTPMPSAATRTHRPSGSKRRRAGGSRPTCLLINGIQYSPFWLRPIHFQTRFLVLFRNCIFSLESPKKPKAQRIEKSDSMSNLFRTSAFQNAQLKPKFK